VDIFVLIVIKAFGQSRVQNLVAKPAAGLPWGTIGHKRKRPLRCSRPADKGQRLAKQPHRVPFYSHNFIMVVCGCNIVLGAKNEDNLITYSVRVYARPFLNQIRDSLVATQDDYLLA
jgi:hypothetical protein